MTNHNVLLIVVLYGSAISKLASGSTTKPSRNQWNTVRVTDTTTISKGIRSVSPSMIFSVRGGSTAAETDNESTLASPGRGDTADAKDLGTLDNTEEEEDDGNDEGAQGKPATMSSQPARLLIQTNWGNSVLDQRVEITTRRTNNISGLKKQVSRLLPGRPPVLGLELVYGGKVLDDEMLVDELFDDDEEEEEELEEGDDSDAAFKVLTLNSVPPVDPKFAIELAPKLKSHIEDDEDTLTTEELIEAYFLNQAAMSRNALLLAQPNAPSSPLLRVEIQEQAKQLKDKLRSQVPEDVWEASLTAIKRDHNTEEIRGQRYRSGKGGARTSLKKSIQTNFNIDWAETIYNSLLLLFFGFFGGRNTVSRTLMLWGAPLCFILQARPVKMWSKTLFYLMTNPPGIVSSLLPAPQQAILNADMEKSYAALYRPMDATTEKVSTPAARTSSQRKTVERETVSDSPEGTKEQPHQENDVEDDSEEVDESEEEEEDDETEDEE